MKKQTKNLLKLEHKVLFVFRENKQKDKNHFTDTFDTTTGTTLTSTSVPTTSKTTTGIF